MSMSYELVTKILNEMGIRYAYYEFNGPITDDRYIAYFEDEKERVFADDKVYVYEPHFAVELYTKRKEPDTEKKLIDLFGKYDVAWSGGSSVYIDSEKVYQTVFYC